jgi:hypothetical protein
MYGNAVLGSDGPLPKVTWAGREHIGTVFLVATPNEGTFLALQRLEEGVHYHERRGSGAFSPDTLFTYPSVFDMIPRRLPPLVDDDGQPLPFKLDDPKDWERSSPGPSSTPIASPRFRTRFGASTWQASWREAAGSGTRLNQLADTPNPVPIYAIAGGAHRVQRTALVSTRKGEVRVRFDPPASGRSRLKPLLFEPGDDMIATRSLVAEDSSHDPASSLNFTQVLHSKKTHHAVISSPEVLAALEGLLK